MSKKLKYILLFISIIPITGCSLSFNKDSKEDNSEIEKIENKSSNDLHEGMSVGKKDVSDEEDTIVYSKFDKSLFSIEIHKSDPPKSLKDWCLPEENIVVINGGFFTEDYQTTALLITDEGKEGVSYEGETKGVFYSMMNGKWDLKDLEDGVGDISGMQYALQSFPMLVDEGKGAVKEDSGKKAKRSFVALDSNGDLILANTLRSSFSLYELSQYLKDSDLNIEQALNLDGGPSSGLCIKDKEGELIYEDYSLSLIPYVIVVKNSL